jgi:hypothetical protein
MTRTVTEDDPELDGLAMLLIDVLAGEAEELELLARYARAPEQLESDQRSEIELRIAESPALADQLRVLRRFAARDWSPGGASEPPAHDV